jgi:hypothetical protein
MALPGCWGTCSSTPFLLAIQWTIGGLTADGINMTEARWSGKSCPTPGFCRRWGRPSTLGSPGRSEAPREAKLLGPETVGRPHSPVGVGGAPTYPSARDSACPDATWAFARGPFERRPKRIPPNMSPCRSTLDPDPTLNNLRTLTLQADEFVYPTTLLPETVRPGMPPGRQRCSSERRLRADHLQYHLIFAGDSDGNSLKSLVLRPDDFMHHTSRIARCRTVP